MVDSTNLPNVDINQIATDLNNKMDRDCLNYSDTGYNFMAGASMPSDTYIDLTLGASGSTYTAPANGYVYFNKVCTGAGQHITLSTNVPYRAWSTASGQSLLISTPVKKGANYNVFYSAGGSLNAFRFIYAQGAESEAN